MKDGGGEPYGASATPLMILTSAKFLVHIHEVGLFAGSPTSTLNFNVAEPPLAARLIPLQFTTAPGANDPDDAEIKVGFVSANGNDGSASWTVTLFTGLLVKFVTVRVI
jgi:hypothetical protein